MPIRLLGGLAGLSLLCLLPLLAACGSNRSLDGNGGSGQLRVVSSGAALYRLRLPQHRHGAGGVRRRARVGLVCGAGHPRPGGAQRGGRTDLGMWNIVASPDLPVPQGALRQRLCSQLDRTGADCSRAPLAAFLRALNEDYQ